MSETRMNPYPLESGEQRSEDAPDTFWIPSRENREALLPGDICQLIFQLPEFCERMWVLITERNENTGMHLGELLNLPVQVCDLFQGDLVRFGPDHVIDIASKPHRPLLRLVH